MPRGLTLPQRLSLKKPTVGKSWILISELFYTDYIYYLYLKDLDEKNTIDY